MDGSIRLQKIPNMSTPYMYEACGGPVLIGTIFASFILRSDIIVI